MAARIAQCWASRTSCGRHNFHEFLRFRGISDALFRDIILATAAKIGGKLVTVDDIALRKKKN